VQILFGWTLDFETTGKPLPEMESRIRSQVEELSGKLSGWGDSDDTIRVQITYTRQEFDEATHGLMPDWSIGAADPSSNTIILYFPESSKSPKAISLVKHELAHIILHRALEDIRIPRWFDEGFAQWVSGPMEQGQAVRLAMANFTGERVDLWELEGLNSWGGNQAELAYAESRAAFEYLVASIDGDIFGLIRSIRRLGDFEEGFEDFTGVSMLDFYRQWANIRVDRFNWSLILLDWRTIFAIITVLFLIGGTIKLVRNKRKRDEDNSAEHPQSIEVIEESERD
jgi:hypothetical protein